MGQQEYTPIPGMSLADSTNSDMWDLYCTWSIGMEFPQHGASDQGMLSTKRVDMGLWP